MPIVSANVVIEKSSPAVFSALEDPKVQITFDDMFRGVEKLTPGPIAKGTRFRGDFKGMGKVEYEYVDFERNRLIVHGVKMPFGAMRHSFAMSPEKNGATRLDQSIQADLNLLGKILWPIMMKKKFEQRLATLNGLVKTYVEGH
jgi:hypothetical protein